jgi:hypothetical protein
MSYTGLYEGIVLDNKDPLDRLRLKIRVIGIHDENLAASDLPWATCGSYPYTGNQHGELRRPNVNSNVFVQFKNGDVNFPVWTAQPLYEGDIRNTDERRRVNGSYRVDVKLDHDHNTWGSSSIRVGGMDYRNVARSQRLVVGINQLIEVGGSLDSSYGGSVSKLIRGGYILGAASYRATITGPSETIIGGDRTETISGKSNSETVGPTRMRTTSLQIETDGPLRLKTKEGSIEIKDVTSMILRANKIYVDGDLVELGTGESGTPGKAVLLEPAVQELMTLADSLSALSTTLSTVMTSLGTAVPAVAPQAASVAASATNLVACCAAFKVNIQQALSARTRAT